MASQATDHATTAALEYLVDECLPLLKVIPTQFDPADIEVLKIRGCPSRIANLIAAHSVALMFGDQVVATLPGFYFVPHNEGGGCWWIDIDERLASRGLILPVRNHRGLIVGLRIYRHARDTRPFSLATRKVKAA